MNKRFLKKCAGISLVCLVCAAQAWGIVFEVNNIRYLTTGDNTVAVTYRTIESYVGDVTVHSTVTYAGVTYNVTSIGSQAFQNCDLLTSVALPEGITSIGEYAFWGCGSLTSLAIPDAVAAIGECAFYYCDMLASVAVGNQNAAYSSDNGVLFNKAKTKLVLCPAGKTGAYTIPGTVTHLGEASFFGCGKLTSLNIPGSVTHIEASAIAYCTGLTAVALPASVRELGSYAFSGCSSLTLLTLPDGIEKIGSFAFSRCSSLTSLAIPNSVVSLGDAVFNECSSLTSVALPGSSTRVGESAFSGCGSLLAVTIPDGVTYIGDVAFSGCSSLASLVIPAGVAYIGDAAFYGCSSLTSIEVGWTAPPAFPGNVTSGMEDVGSSCVITVPAGTKPLYQASAFWSKFEIVEKGDAPAPAPVTVSASELSFGANDREPQPVTITAADDVAWTVEKDSAWITLSHTQGAGTRTLNILLSVNPGKARTGKVTVLSDGNAPKTILIKQSANPEIRFEVDGIHYYAAGVNAASVEVTPGASAYSGKVIIPSRVYYSGKYYSVASIGAGAFTGSSITAVALPRSLTHVAGDAFNNCSALDSVEIEWTLLVDAYPVDIRSAFSLGVYLDKITLVVPAGTKALYQSADFWKLFGRITEPGESPTGVAAKASRDVAVRAEAGRLHIDSPYAESIYVYSLTGKLLHTAVKSPGQSTFTLPTNEHLLIVRGTSGWTKKIIN
jgi:hypothetical protein